MSNYEETDLICPVCGENLNLFGWGYGCSGYYAGCDFSIGSFCGKNLTENQVRKLISGESTGKISGFKKKDGTTFSASLILEKDPDNEHRYRLAFEQKDSPKEKMPELYSKCPFCGGRIIKKAWNWACENECGIKLPYIFGGRELTKQEAEALFAAGQTPILENLISKKKKPFRAYFQIIGSQVEVFFPKRED